MSTIPENLKYTKEHEWIKIENNIATIGVTDFAQQELGDIVYVDIDTLDEDLTAGDVFGSVEAVKTVSDLFIPLSGTIIEINTDLEEQPELINTSPYEDGWIVKVKINEETSLDNLLEPNEYLDLIGE